MEQTTQLARTLNFTDIYLKDDEDLGDTEDLPKIEDINKSP